MEGKMEFRPCIDIHNGKVKQLVGGSVADTCDRAQENFVSSRPAAWYASLFEEKGLKNGHVIILNSKSSPYYEASRRQALEALRAYPGGLQAGGGITAENAAEYLDAGASHVIVTSYVFRDGTISYENLNRLLENVGKKKLVLDLSCRKKDGAYYIMTDRWQKYTRVILNEDVLDRKGAGDHAGTLEPHPDHLRGRDPFPGGYHKHPGAGKEPDPHHGGKRP